jgi:hypothetical protein
LPNKGRLTEQVASLLAEAGLPISACSDRALVATLGGEFEAIFVRAEDIPAERLFALADRLGRLGSGATALRRGNEECARHEQPTDPCTHGLHANHLV